MKVVVLGGYGNFGARIVRALAADSRIELVVGARNLERARAFATPLDAQAVRLDADDPAFGQQLREQQAGLVIHTAGPFQGQEYAVARAAADAGCHYIDLADGRRFVCDFAGSLDAAFRAAGRIGISGASTVPALSSAAVDALKARFGRMELIDCCIAPAQRAPRGEATIAGVLSYCGAPVQVWRDGRWHAMRGWARPQVVRFARLKPRRGALCDIPDLELFPARYPQVEDVMFRAALEVPATQYAFAGLALLRACGLPVSSPRVAGWLHRTGGWFDALGTRDGGMVVRVHGDDARGKRLQLAWHITAPDDHGPEIPCMAAVLLARKLAAGQALPIGAHACMGLLALEEFTPEFARWGMQTELVEEGVHGA